MAVRTAYAGTTSAGDVLTSANFTKLPGGWIGYAQATANQTGISALTDLTSLTVTVTVGTSRRIKIVGQVLMDNQYVGVNNIQLLIRESGTTLGQGQGFFNQSGVTGDIASLHAEVILTPSAGSHTYKLSISATNYNVDMIAAATYPAFILVEDIGPSA